MGELRNGYMVLIGKPEGKRPLERSRRRLEDNIKIDSEFVGFWTLSIVYFLSKEH
jgi:hypothetical protein